jgi:uncharacterized membrane protein YqjE
VRSDQPHPAGTERSATGLLSDAVSHLSRMVRGEVALAQSEMVASLRTAFRGIALVAVALVFAITALNLIASALVIALTDAGLSVQWATVAVAGGSCVTAVIAAWLGLSALKPARFVPSRALRGLRRDAETIKEGVTP